MTGPSAQTRTIYSVTVPAELEHDSNPNMTVGDSPGTTWLRVVPQLTAGYVHGTERYELEGALRAEKSSNPDVARDRLDPRLRGVWKHAGERDTTELAALLDRRAFRSLDVQEHLPIGVDGSRTLLALTGNWVRDLDARTAFRGDLSQEWERYSDARTPDFRRTTAAVRLTRQQDERRSWYGGLNGQVYRSDPDEEPLPRPVRASRSTVVGALVGVKQAVSEGLSIEANAGPVHFTEPSSKTDWQGAVTAEYTGERWLAGLDIARRPGVNPTFGGLLVSDEVRLRLRYDLGALTRLEVDAGHRKEKASGSRRTAASVALVRQWSPSWQVAVRASAHQQEDPVGTARSNRISLVLVYSAPDL